MIGLIVRGVLICWFASCGLLVVATVGKERTTMTPRHAVIAVVLSTLEILAVVFFWGAS